MACSFMMEYIRGNLFLPGQVENWNIMIDLDNLGLMSVPYKVIILLRIIRVQSLKSFMETLQSQYRCTSSRIFIMNVSYIFNMVWSTVKGFLEEHTKKKIQLTKASTCDELQALFAPNQLEIKYGGKAPNVESNFWPPIMPSQDVGCDPEKLIPENQYQEYVNARPSLNKKPGFNHRNQEEEEKKQSENLENSLCNVQDHNEENLHLSDFEDKNAGQKKDVQNYFHEDTMVCRNYGKGLNKLNNV